MSATLAPPAALEYRAATMTGISWPQRTIELIVMPYEQEAIVEHRGRYIREVVSRGAFDGIDQRPNRVKLNRDHDVTRTCGHAVTFRPSDDEGLVAEVYVANTVLGKETLELASIGDLSASAGFAPMPRPDAEAWPERDLRRLNKIYLGHIALTPDPAYEGARVKDVRSDAPDGLAAAPGGILVARPNLDMIRAERLADMYSRLSR